MLNKIEAAVRKDPQRIAYRVGDEQVTYRGLWERALERSVLLQKQGVEPVILFGRKSVDYVTAILACLMARRAYVPVGRFTPPERMRHIASQTGATLLLSDNAPEIEGLVCTTLGELDRFASQPTRSPGQDIAYIIFTSGSTGQPKGVPISRDNLNNFAEWISGLPPLNEYREVTVLNQADFSFDLSVADLYYALCNGHTLVSVNSDEGTYSEELFRVMKTVDVAVMTPTLMKMCLLNGDFNAGNYPDFRCVYFCGEPLEPNAVRQLLDAFPTLSVINAYGPTEATSAVSAILISREMTELPLLPVGDASNFATGIRIDDGEIVLTGKSVFGGYLGGVKGGYFRENGVNCYRTGDLGYIENGCLYCRGRKDRQVKYQGYRIELDEIEYHISKISGVKQCAVIAKYDANGAVRLIKAFVAADTGAAEIKSALRNSVPEYMIPKSIQMVDSLPVNQNGKTDRKALS